MGKLLHEDKNRVHYDNSFESAIMKTIEIQKKKELVRKGTFLQQIKFVFARFDLNNNYLFTRQTHVTKDL